VIQGRDEQGHGAKVQAHALRQADMLAGGSYPRSSGKQYVYITSVISALAATKKPLRVNKRTRSQMAEILGEPV